MSMSLVTKKGSKTCVLVSSSVPLSLTRNRIYVPPGIRDPFRVDAPGRYADRRLLYSLQSVARFQTQVQKHLFQLLRITRHLR